MSRTARGQDADPAIDENLLYSCLELLGLPPATVQKQYGAELHKTVFRQSNVKAFEFVLHFLFEHIRGKDVVKRELKGIWPTTDRQQSQEFLKKVADWLKQLRDAGDLEASFVAQASNLKTAGGQKIITLLLSLAHLAINRALVQAGEPVVLPQKQPRNGADVGPIISAVRDRRNRRQAQRLWDNIEELAAVRSEARKAAEELRTHHQQLKLKLETQEHSTAWPHDLSGQDQQLAEQLAEFDALSSPLQQELQVYPELQQMVQAVVDHQVHPYAIDGARLAALTGAGDGSSMGSRSAQPAGLLSPFPSPAKYLSTPGLSTPQQPLDLYPMLEAWIAKQWGSARHIAALGSRHTGSPLIASSAPSSHAPHILAQLNKQRSASEQLAQLMMEMQEQRQIAESDSARLEKALRTALAMGMPDPQYLVEMCAGSEAQRAPLARPQSSSSSVSGAPDGMTAAGPLELACSSVMAGDVPNSSVQLQGTDSHGLPEQLAATLSLLSLSSGALTTSESSATEIAAQHSLVSTSSADAQPIRPSVVPKLSLGGLQQAAPPAAPAASHTSSNTCSNSMIPSLPHSPSSRRSTQARSSVQALQGHQQQSGPAAGGSPTMSAAFSASSPQQVPPRMPRSSSAATRHTIALPPTLPKAVSHDHVATRSPRQQQCQQIAAAAMAVADAVLSSSPGGQVFSPSQQTRASHGPPPAVWSSSGPMTGGHSSRHGSSRLHMSFNPAAVEPAAVAARAPMPTIHSYNSLPLPAAQQQNGDARQFSRQHSQPLVRNGSYSSPPVLQHSDPQARASINDPRVPGLQLAGPSLQQSASQQHSGRLPDGLLMMTDSEDMSSDPDWEEMSKAAAQVAEVMQNPAVAAPQQQYQQQQCQQQQLVQQRQQSQQQGSFAAPVPALQMPVHTSANPGQPAQLQQEPMSVDYGALPTPPPAALHWPQQQEQRSLPQPTRLSFTASPAVSTSSTAQPALPGSASSYEQSGATQPAPFPGDLSSSRDQLLAGWQLQSEVAMPSSPTVQLSTAAVGASSALEELKARFARR